MSYLDDANETRRTGINKTGIPLGWRITGCSVDGEEDLIGTGSNLASEEAIGHEDRQLWRVLDDDGIEYFRGVIWGDHYLLEPLDDWATACYGATLIEYRKKATEKWKPVN